jgi:quinolinate synthase
MTGLRGSRATSAITMDEEIRKRALLPIEKMLAMS